ncbi:hypothetical protein OF376_00340 [Ureaplasma miroungigenitalium]|uniref:Lipoprotein n=1 Tax=Ureaplasma miroungigenitalium TaxID=1042321 RepID=A0ABT3BLW0_9BACT|nr:hypothetical protein [Ureaplasma miroungigenitalium]MCV3728238.1 hypothetical protein [Ureaplasma miroungigenitalium]
MKKKNQLKWCLLSLGTVVLATTAISLTACGNKSAMDQEFANLESKLNQWYKNTTATQKITYADNLRQEFISIQVDFKKSKDESEKEKYLDKAKAIITQIEAIAKDPDHYTPNQPKEGEEVNEVNDGRFNNLETNQQWEEQKTLEPNQHLKGKSLKENEKYQGLMIFNWIAHKDHNSALVHTHNHKYVREELRRQTNLQKDGYKIIDGHDLHVSAETGRLNGVDVYYTLLENIKNTGFNNIQLRFDGIGASSDSLPASLSGSQEGSHNPHYTLNFQLPVEYLANKKTVAITGISFQHMHGEYIGDQWTVQFKTPIIIPIR